MKPELFLEEVGQLQHAHHGTRLWRVDRLADHPSFRGRALPPCIFVVDFPGNGPGQRLLLGRHLCGPAKFRLIRETAHTMMRLFGEELAGSVAQFVILWGGRPLDLIDADPPLADARLIDTTYVKLTRVPDSGASRGWRIEQSAWIGRWWQADVWIVMEECLASGSTLRHFIAAGLEQHRPRKIFIFPVCGSAEGLEGAHELCAERGVAFVPVLNSAVIQVAREGLNLPFTDLGLQPGTIVSRDFHRALDARYQGRPLCWVGDIGDSLYTPEEYLMDTLQDMLQAGLDLEREDFSSWPPLLRAPAFAARLAEERPALHAAVARLVEGQPCSG